MRRAPSALAAAAVLILAACSSSSLPAGTAPPADHYHPSAPPVVYPAASAPPAYPPYQQAPAPNAQGSPYDGTTFQSPGVNPYVDASRDQRSTFALDVDTASYTVARRFVSDGNMPDPASVRVEEWVNYFDQGYAAPESGTFAIYADGGPAPVLPPDQVLLRVGIKAREVTRRERPPAALTFVIDVSGSMGRDGRLELVKQSLRLLVDQLRRTDTVSIVAFTTNARVVLGPTCGAERDAILRAIDTLEPENTTNVDEGLRLGYDLARRQLLEGGINRVVLASDGVANVGLTDPDAILAGIRSDAAAGIQLVSVGVGMGNYNDALLEQVADQGDGFYAYVDTLEEARRLFVEDLVSTLDTVALDAKVQLDFDPQVVDEYRLIGFENRAIPDREFRDNSVQAGAIGAGHSVTALYALRLREGAGRNDRIATVSLRWTDPDTNKATEIAEDVNGGNLSPSFASTNPHFKLDALVAAAAEVLRGSPWTEGYGVRDIAEFGRKISLSLPQTQEAADFVDLLVRAAHLDP